MTPAPDKIRQLYLDIITNADMDNGTYIGGTDVYQADRVLEHIAELAGWELPQVTCEDLKENLREQGREYDIELLGVNGVC